MSNFNQYRKENISWIGPWKKRWRWLHWRYEWGRMHYQSNCFGTGPAWWVWEENDRM